MRRQGERQVGSWLSKNAYLSCDGLSGSVVDRAGKQAGGAGRYIPGMTLGCPMCCQPPWDHATLSEAAGHARTGPFTAS